MFVSPAVAYELSNRGLPWVVHLECYEGGSNKFWEASSDGSQTHVRIRYGKRWSNGQTLNKDFTYFNKKSQEKMKPYNAKSKKGGYQLHGSTVSDLQTALSRIEGIKPCLTGPYAKIRIVSLLSNMDLAEAYDGKGTLVMKLYPKVAAELCRDYTEITTDNAETASNLALVG